MNATNNTTNDVTNAQKVGIVVGAAALGAVKGTIVVANYTKTTIAPTVGHGVAVGAKGFFAFCKEVADGAKKGYNQK